MPPRKPLQPTLWDIQKRFGDGAISILGQREAPSTGLRTGVSELDTLLGTSGIPKGQISVFVGKPTCGMTTLTLRLLAHAQGTSDATVYLDLSGTFDPDYASIYGVATDRLVLAQPENPVQALEIARDFAISGRVTLIVIDLFSAEPPALMDLNDSLRRLNEHVKGPSAVVFLLPMPLRTLDTYTHTRLLLERMNWLEQHNTVRGYQVRVTVEKHKPYPAGQSVMIDFVLDPRIEGGDW